VITGHDTNVAYMYDHGRRQRSL